MSHPPSHQPPPGPHHSPFGPPPPPQGLPTAAKVALGGASAGTALLVLLLIGYFVWVRPGDTSIVAEPPPSADTTESSDQASDPEESQEPVEDPPDDGSADDSQDPGTPPDFPDFDVQEFSGSGNSTVEVEPFEDPRIVSMSHEGSGGFFVEASGSESITPRTLARRGGDYEGRVLVSPFMDQPVEALEVIADGDWEISFEPLSSAVHWEANEQEFSGSGDDVLQLLWTPTNFATLDVTHDGVSNFYVASHDNVSQNMLVNEIGRYEGDFSLTPSSVVIAVEADGSWTITR